MRKHAMISQAVDSNALHWEKGEWDEDTFTREWIVRRIRPRDRWRGWTRRWTHLWLVYVMQSISQRVNCVPYRGAACRCLRVASVNALCFAPATILEVRLVELRPRARTTWNTVWLNDGSGPGEIVVSRYPEADFDTLFREIEELTR